MKKPQRKSVDPSTFVGDPNNFIYEKKQTTYTIDEGKEEKDELAIEEVPRTSKIDDFLPKLDYRYKGIHADHESEAMVEDFENFLKDNAELVLKDYETEKIEDVQKGFQRAAALAGLYFRSIFLEPEGEDREA